MESPIYCRIELDNCLIGDRSTGIYVIDEQWNSKKQEIIDNPFLQSKLEEFRLMLKKNHLKYELTGESINVNKLLNKINNPNKDQLSNLAITEITLLSLIEEYKIFKSRKIKRNTFDTYEVAIRHIRAYLSSIDKLKILPKEFNEELAYSYFEWLVGENNNFENNYSRRLVLFLKSALDYGKKKLVIVSNPIAEIEIKKTKCDHVVHLTLEELNRIENFKFASEHLQKCADLFLFQCYTGLDYGDLNSIKISNVCAEEFLNFISKPRNKTKKTAIIPITAKVRDIWEKYSYNLPKFANATLNKALKQIALFTNIKKRVTTHIGRKTFAMIAINYYGISLTAVSKMLGHGSIRTTEDFYAKATKESIVNEFSRLNLITCEINHSIENRQQHNVGRLEQAKPPKTVYEKRA